MPFGAQGFAGGSLELCTVPWSWFIPVASAGMSAAAAGAAGVAVLGRAEGWAAAPWISSRAWAQGSSCCLSFLLALEPQAPGFAHDPYFKRL